MHAAYPRDITRSSRDLDGIPGSRGTFALDVAALGTPDRDARRLRARCISRVAPRSARSGAAPRRAGAAGRRIDDAHTRAPTSHHLALPWSGVADGCARTSDAHLACWGGRFPAAPRQVGGIDHVAGVAGEQEIYGWTSDGAVFYLDDRGAPRRIPGIADAIEVAVGGGHACARRKIRRRRVLARLRQERPEARPRRRGRRCDHALEIAVTQTRGCLRDARGVACWKLESDAPVIDRVADTAGATSLTGGYAGIAVTRAGAAPLEVELQPVRCRAWETSHASCRAPRTCR